MKHSFRLKSEESFNSINRSPTNRSLSKQTYAFSKSPRFHNFRPQCPQFSYNGKTPRGTKEGTSIGYGKKSDFTKDLTCSPGSSKYHMSTNFEDNKTKLKGYTMGSSRQKIAFRCYVNKQMCLTPSCSKYNIEKANVSMTSPRFSIRSRTKVLDKSKTIQSQNSNPGPGNYENPEIQAKSKHANRFPTISYPTSRSIRFGNSDNRVPGAGTYEQASALSNTGKYVLSRYQGGTIAKIGQSKRLTKFDEIAERSRRVPGVGSYRCPSEFGQYDGDIYEKFSTIEVPSNKLQSSKR